MRFWSSNGAKSKPAPQPEPEPEDCDCGEDEPEPELEPHTKLSGKIAPLTAVLGFKLRDRDGVPTLIWSNRAERPATETEVTLHERILVLENELVAMHKFLTEAAGSLTKRITAVDALRSTPAAAPTPPPQNAAAAAPAPAATPTATQPNSASMSSAVAAVAKPTPAMSEARRNELRAKFRSGTIGASPASKPKLPG